MKIRTLNRMTLIGIVSLLFLSGCTLSYTPGRSELTGTWIHQGPNGIDTELVLNGNGTFTIDSVPKNVFLWDGQFDSEAVWENILNVQGRWTQRDDGRVDLAQDMTVVGFPSNPVGVDYSGAGEDLRLFRFVGPEEDLVKFEFIRSAP